MENFNCFERAYSETATVEFDFEEFQHLKDVINKELVDAQYREYR